MKRLHWIALALVVVGALTFALARTQSRPALAVEDEPFFENNGWFQMHKRSTIKLDGKAGWVDTRVQLIPGQELRVVANGLIAFKTDFNRTPLRRRGPAGDKLPTTDNKGIEGIHYHKAKLPAPELTPFALVGRVISLSGEVTVKPFEIGADMVMAVPAEGELQITSNDDSHYDNQGAWTVTVLNRKLPSATVEPFGKDKPAE